MSTATIDEPEIGLDPELSRYLRRWLRGGHQGGRPATREAVVARLREHAAAMRVELANIDAFLGRIGQ